MIEFNDADLFDVSRRPSFGAVTHATEAAHSRGIDTSTIEDGLIEMARGPSEDDGDKEERDLVPVSEVLRQIHDEIAAATKQRAEVINGSTGRIDRLVRGATDRRGRGARAG